MILRIQEIVISPEEGQHGVMYVANDGKPFSESNFRSLSQLGQSDKNPQESIGNKGIGFRSVLEITTSPEIFSRSSEESSCFDGFCFCLSPEIIQKFKDPIIQLFKGEDRASSPLDPATPLVDWGAEILSKFRTSIKLKGESWLARELNYLSPYLLPFPISIPSENSLLLEFQKRGYMTVIRFPFKNAKARELAREKLEEIDANAILFLSRARFLVLDSGNVRRELERKWSCKLPGTQNGQEIFVHDSNESEPRIYWLWDETVRTADASDEFRDSLMALPGKWPELKEAVITLAVRIDEKSEKGKFSIFLPTELSTGCATHISAPFFGDMSRTDIDFKNSYNRYLLHAAANKALDIALKDLKGQGINQSLAIVDLLSPWPGEKIHGERWFGILETFCESREISIHTEAVILSDKGWDSLENTSLIPPIRSAVLMTEEVLRKHACFPAVVPEMSGRIHLLESFFEAVGIDPYPLERQKADTVEAIAGELFRRGGEVDWNGFWRDTISLLAGDSAPLKGKKVLLGTDNALHASGEDCSVFFIPKQGSLDDEEVDSEGALHEIPPGLKDYVAFLHEDIQVYDERDARVQTPIRKFLDTKLVQRFRVEDILTSVLIRRTPKLPIPLRGPDSALCRDILLWGLSLVTSLVDRGKGEKTLRHLKHLPVPCRGGWYALRLASFGPGWKKTLGKNTLEYLQGARSDHCKEAIKRLLVNPSDDLWGNLGERYQEILSAAGIFDGLRLSKIETESGASRLNTSRDYFHLPDSTPAGIPKNLWDDYSSYVSREAKRQLTYSGLFAYVIQDLQILPGLEGYPDFDETTRLLLMRIVLGSITRWEDSWSTITISKAEGYADKATLSSPIAFALRSLPWLGIESGESIEWAKPADRWYVTCERLSGKPRLFAHLKPLTGKLAQMLDGDPSLAGALKNLGLPKFDTETRSPSMRLLNSLANALDGEILDFNVFLGQVRAAWGAFEPGNSGSFPRKIIIRHGNNPLSVHIPVPESPVYLPDSSASFIDALEQFSLPVIAIETIDAKRLASGFKAFYGDGIQLASHLQLIPLVNGIKWEGIAGTLLVDSELEWVIPLVLTLVAFTGVQAKGTNSEPFQKRVQMFREARLSWVPSLEAGLFKNEEKVVSPPVPAIWLEKEKVLLVTEETREQPHLLSEALAFLIQRDDLELPIKFALKEIRDCDPELDDIKNAMMQLKVSEAQYSEAREQWRGDLGQLIRMIRPLVMIIHPSADIGRMVELETEESVIAFLNNLNVINFDGKKILSLARASRNSRNLGKAFYQEFGDHGQLAIWNEKLKFLGDSALENVNAQNELQTHIASAYLQLRSVLAEIIRRTPSVGKFKEFSEQLDSVDCPIRFFNDFWEVSFNMTMEELVPIFETIGATPAELEAIGFSSSPEDLRERLKLAGVDVDFDPLLVATTNRDLLKRNLQRFLRIGLAWCLRQNNSNTASWEKGGEQFLEMFSDVIESLGYVCTWTDEYVFSLLKLLPRDETQGQFWQEVDAATNIEDLLTATALSVKDLEEAQEKLDAFKEKSRRQKKLIAVCGKEFDSSDDNMVNLWAHICEGLGCAALDALGSVNLQSVVKLKPVTSRRKKDEKGNGGGKPKPTRGHLSKSMENLIGLSGEIHAFRLLQKSYGPSIVHPGTWVSGNSNYVFADNNVDDGRGCDFVIHCNGKTYCIEVKASQGDDEAFKLGSSEIRLAMELSKKKRNRKELFQILHVTNALSETPAFRLLPNPYDPKYQSFFVVEDADARVRYKHP